MNKKIKVIMLILLMCIVVISITIGVLINMQKQENKRKEEVYATDQDVSLNYELTSVNSKYEFFDVQECINQYTNILKSLNKERYDNGYRDQEVLNEIEKTLEGQREKLYHLLGEEYIQLSNITTDSIDSKFSKYYGETIFNIENMRVIDINKDLSIYVIDGQMVSNSILEEYQFIIKKDAFNLTFAVYPQDYIKAIGNLDNALEKIKANKDTQIQNKQDNTYSSKSYDDEYISKYYFTIYKNNIITNPEYIYDKLDKEYREKRFETLQAFKKYITENQSEIMKIQFTQYLLQENDNSVEYVCKDQYGNIYIFRQTNLGEYSLMLDTYTLEQEKFNTEYQKATNQKKVMMNIDKFFQMINAKDYKQAYALLNDDFKKNYFKTEEDFKKYLQQNVFSYNDVEYVSYSDEISSIYKYDLIIKNRLNNSQEINFTIAMQLKEGTGFVMSFSIN